MKELETHVLLAARVGLCQIEPVDALLAQTDQLGRMQRTLIAKLESRPR